MKDLSNYSLKEHNTFGIEARCRRFLEYADEDEARQVAAIVRDADSPYIIIGGGSNLLLTKDFDGIVVHSAIKGISMEERMDYFVVVCGSGEQWDDVVAWCVERKNGSLVNLSLIPGDVGASAVQNIGAYGAEVGQFVDEIRAVDIASGEMVTIGNDQCRYGYRDSRFKHDWRNRFLITQVSYRLPKDGRLNVEYGNIRMELERRGIAEPTAAELRQTIIDIRNAKLPDPKVEGNAGSFYMNPVVSREKYLELAALYENMPHYDIDENHVKIPAGWMIEVCGWKGRRMGNAGVHSKQALVLVNKGGATGLEIVALCDAVRQDVKARFGIDIYPEVNIV